MPVTALIARSAAFSPRSMPAEIGLDPKSDSPGMTSSNRVACQPSLVPDMKPLS